MNFKYKVGDDAFILTGEEHALILKAIELGKKTLVSLRGGQLILNLSFIRSVQSTNHLVEQDFSKLALPFPSKELRKEQTKGRDEKIKSVRKVLEEKGVI